MIYFTDRKLSLDDRKVQLMSRNLPSQRAARSLPGIACATALLFAATCAHAQFGAQPVGAAPTMQGIQVTATVAGTVSNVEVLTLGSSSGDFAVGTGSSNCGAASLTVGGKCTESVSFTAAAPGLRLGAVVLVGTVGGVKTVLGTAYLSGTGVGGLGVLVTGNVLPVAGQLGLFTAVEDGQPATQAELDLPGGAVVDGAGNLYIADAGHHRIRMVCAGATSATIAGTGTNCTGQGIIVTIAGDGNPAYTGDSGSAASATVNSPGDVALDGAGNLYIADSGNNVIRMISSATGVITTVAGNGAIGNSNLNQVGDGGLATAANLNLPQGITLDGSGNLYIADTNNHRIREVNAATGNISTIAGSGFTNPNGTGGYNGDNITAITAELNFPYAVAFDLSGNMYIPDSANNRVREVQAVGGVITATSNITTFAGTGLTGATPCTATPVAANQAVVWSPSGVAVDAAGNVYIAETQNAAIRKVSGPGSSTAGYISSFVQNGCSAFYFGGQFVPQALYGPTGLYLDGTGDLYIADTLDMVVREVQGNFVALDFPTPIRQGSTTSPQSQTVENDGNAALDLTTIVPATNAAVDSALANSCTDGQTLAANADCVVGAVFAPAATPPLTVNTAETPSIDVGGDSQPSVAAPNSPLDIELLGTAEPLYSTTTTLTSNPNPSGFGQSVTFTATVTTGAGTGSLTGTVSISDTFGGVTTTLASGLPMTASGSTSATAIFAISTLAVGQHSITATYNNANDPPHSPSTSSPALIQTVIEGTAVSLASSVNPSTVGQSVTFTATVSSPGGGVSPTGTVTFFDGATPLATQTLNGGGVATYTTATLANGVHQMTAVYNGSSGTQVQGSTSNVVSQDVQVPSTIAVVSNLNPSNYGNPVTFTATVTSTATSPASGTVNFLDNGVSIGSGTLGGNPGKATFTISTLVVGTHPITVTYAGDSYNVGSSSTAPLNQVVQQAATVTTVAATPTPGIAGLPETISATVQLLSGSAPLAGTVTFTSGTTTLGSASLNASGVATITPTLAPGAYQIVATYMGNTNGIGSASAPLSYSVVLATTQTALAVTPSPALVLNPVTFTATVTGNGVTPTGSVNFLANGVVIGTAPLAGGIATFTDSGLAAGSYTMTAEYLGNTDNATSTSTGVSETVGTIPTTTVLGTAATTGASPQVVLVAAVLNNGAGPTPTGTVTFYNGATSLGTATLDSTGAATLTPNLTAGVNYSIDAVYSGDADHGSSTSQTLTVSGTPVGFGVSVTPATLTLATSQNATVTVTITSNANFTDTIGLGCSSLPAVVNCHFAAISLKLPAGGTVSTQLTIDTNNPLSGGSTAMNRRPGSGKFSLAGLFLPVSLGFGCIFWWMRRRNARFLTAVLVLVLTAAAFVATGCNSFSQATAAPGTYVIQVTGTGASSDIVHYQNVTLDITK
jgi:large repetitive protein